MALDVGGGGGDRAARFTYMQVPDFWDMVRSHDSAQHQQALQGWRQSYELVLMHRTQVEKYKEKLITAWPPQRSSAARAYIERLDHLIENLTETYNAAIANHSAYSTAIAAMDDAKRKLETIQQEHAANTVALAQHEEELKNRPRAYGKAPMPAPPASPVAAGRQEELRLQAEKLITGVSAELATAQLSLTAPKPYSPQAAFSDSSDNFNPGGQSPVIPTISARSGRTTTPSRVPGRTPIPATVSNPKGSTRDPKSGALHPSNNRVEQPISTKIPLVGPILGGTTQPSIPPATSLHPTPTPLTPSTQVPDFNSFSPTHQASGPTALPRPPIPNGSSGSIAPIGSSPFGAAPPPTGGRAPSSPLHGGVIGGTPPIGSAPSGRPGSLGTTGRGTPKANPLGGVIGHDAATSAGRRVDSKSEDKKQQQRWDPDNPWQTEIGMDPVLLPSREQRIDPGPTIGGR